MIKNPKWLNRRNEDGVLRLPTLSKIASKEISNPLLDKLRFLWFAIPLFIGVLVATPLGIIFNTSSTSPVSPSPQLQIIPIPPQKFIDANTSTFDFDLEGWQPSSNQHFYGIHRPSSPYNQNFESIVLSVPTSSNDYGKEYIQNNNNSNIASEYFSYSFDEESFNQCSEDLLNQLTRRVSLPDDDVNKINIPLGYSLTNLFNRIKYTYCTFFKPSRESLIQEMKNPYISSPRLDVFSPKGDLIVSTPDSVYQKRDMWYEHDGSIMGERSYEFNFPTLFPEGYRTRFKVPLNNDVLGYNLHSLNVKNSTVLLDSRYTLMSEIFYRYFVNSPLDDIANLYEPKMRDRISDPDVIKRTLVRPGMGPQNTWAQNVFRDYSGDTSFTLLNKDIVAVLPGNSVNLIAIPEGWNTNNQLNYLWNDDFSVATNAITKIMEAFEFSNIKRVGNFSLNTLDMKEFSNYFLRATFDNSRNVFFNDNFQSDANNTISRTNKMVLYDAYRFGPQRGLGRFYYESLRLSESSDTFINIDQETFEKDMFEENMTSICSGVTANDVYGSSVCPNTKISLTPKNGSARKVYVPNKNNEVTEYYAELEEINNLWTFLYDKFENILDKDYKDVNFTPYDNNRQNAFQRTRAIYGDKTREVESERDNFKIFQALAELFSDSNVVSKFILPYQTSTIIKDKMQQLLLTTISNLNDLGNEASREGNLTLTYNDFELKITNAIKSIQDLINYYAKVEATRKLDTEYNLKVINSNGLEFEYPVKGRNLTYHLYVRYMKMNEAKLNYSYDEQGQKRSFLIYDWDYDPSSPVNLPQFSTRSVNVADANDSELAYFVIHYLKDTRFPWIPIKFETPTKVVNVAKAYNLILSNYSPKYDNNVKEAKEMVNDYMNNLLFKDYKITNTIPPTRSSTNGSNSKWVNFDVAKYIENDSNSNEIATYYERSNFSNGRGYLSNMFQEYTNYTKGLKDFIFYANAHYLISPNSEPFSNENLAQTTHCIVTYESTGVKNELGYDNVLLPINSLNTNTTPSNKLLDYFHVGKNGWRLNNNKLSVSQSNAILQVRSNVYIVPSSVYANTQGHLEKYLHIYFSKCISNDQYKNPLVLDDANYDPQNDEWSNMINKVSLRIKWDLLDIQ